MTALQRPLESSRQPSVRLGMVTTYPPTRCGIARFSQSLVQAIGALDADLGIDVVRLVEHRPPSPGTGRCAMDFDPNSQISLRAAARFLNQRDVAVLQHEYGIYGHNEGENVIRLLDLLDVPSVAVLHTVVREPTAQQRRIIREMSTRSHLVVLCQSARSLLESTYRVSPNEVSVIPHGSHWAPQPINPGPHRNLITWGLLGPGKGLERAILSMAQLHELEHRPKYRIVGRTHPGVVRREGFAYRRKLESMVDRLSLGSTVEFTDRYVDDEDLFDLVKRSDIVVVPYDNTDQVSSGVITDALGLGRPVVATDFTYSREMLKGGAGVIVDHDPASMATALERLMVDDMLYERAAARAAETSAALNWEGVARSYTRLLSEMVSEFATA